MQEAAKQTVFVDWWRLWVKLLYFSLPRKICRKFQHNVFFGKTTSLVKHGHLVDDTSRPFRDVPDRAWHYLAGTGHWCKDDKTHDSWVESTYSSTPSEWALSSSGTVVINLLSFIFYFLKTVVKRNCVYKDNTHIHTIKCYGDKCIDICKIASV